MTFCFLFLNSNCIPNQEITNTNEWNDLKLNLNYILVLTVSSNKTYKGLKRALDSNNEKLKKHINYRAYIWIFKQHHYNQWKTTIIETNKLIVKRSPPIPHINNSSRLNIHLVRECVETTYVITK